MACPNRVIISVNDAIAIGVAIGLLLKALADRADRAALPAIVAIAKGNADLSERAQALRTVGALGGAPEASLLVAALTGDQAVQEAARGGLLAIQGKGVSEQLVALAKDARRTSAERSALFAILTARRDRAALPTMTAAAVAPDADVRRAVADVGPGWRGERLGYCRPAIGGRRRRPALQERPDLGAQKTLNLAAKRRKKTKKCFLCERGNAAPALGVNQGLVRIGSLEWHRHPACGRLANRLAKRETLVAAMLPCELLYDQRGRIRYARVSDVEAQAERRLNSKQQPVKVFIHPELVEFARY